MRIIISPAKKNERPPLTADARAAYAYAAGQFQTGNAAGPNTAE